MKAFDFKYDKLQFTMNTISIQLKELINQRPIAAQTIAPAVEYNMFDTSSIASVPLPPPPPPVMIPAKPSVIPIG